MRLVLLFMIGAAFGAPGVRTDRQPPLLERFIALDAAVFDSPGLAPGAAARFRADASCSGTSDLGRTEACMLGILRDETLRPSDTSAAPLENSVSHAIESGRGSCAALVGVMLGLAKPHAEPFDALVFREHVVLVSRRTGDYFEVLEGGRRLTAGEFERYRRETPFPPERVDGVGFLPFYLDNLAVRLAQAGQSDRAMKVFRMALDRNSRSPRIQYNYGTFLLDRGEHGEAVAHLTRAVRLGWTGPDAFVNRGVALAKLGREKKARRDFERALRIDPANREATTNLRSLSHAPHPANR